MPFDEELLLKENHTFLFENMPTIKSVQVFSVSDPSVETNFPDTKQIREAAVPGKPVVYFF